jgi:hypothetical protein
MNEDEEEGAEEEVDEHDSEPVDDVPDAGEDEDDEDADMEGEVEEPPEEEEMPANWCGPGPYVPSLFLVRRLTRQRSRRMARQIRL